MLALNTGTYLCGDGIYSNHFVFIRAVPKVVWSYLAEYENKWMEREKGERFCFSEYTLSPLGAVH